MKEIKRLLGSYAYGYRLMLFISFLLAILYVGATLVTPILVGYAIDEINEGLINTNKILVYIITLVVIIILGSFAGYFMNYMLSRVTFLTIRDMRNDTFSKLLNVSVKTLDTRAHGDIIARITTDLDVVQDGMIQSLTEALTGIITILVTLIFMLVLNYQIGLIVVALTPLSLIVAAIIARLSFNTVKNTSKTKGDLTSFVNEMIENQKVVIAYNHEEKNEEVFKALDKELYKHGVNAQFYSSLSNPSTRFINAIIYLVVATFGSLTIINGSNLLTVGLLSTFLSYASQYTKPFNSISAVWAELQNSISSLKRIYEWIDLGEIDKNGMTLNNPSGEVIFNDISFSYNGKKQIIKNFNLKVNPGEKVAIVGPTGCGKTTLINLLMKFYEVNTGQILVDGKNINEIDEKSYRENIGMVLQDTWLFDGTIYENIAYGKEVASKEEVVEAAKNAYADDFIMRLPLGYDTHVSADDGVSIGEKQLLCIARLMLRMPNILILDEATSNIDILTEIKVTKAFNKMMKGRTTFIIAHRLQTIKSADKIVVMKDGKIVEMGRHEELLAKNGFYKEIYNSQFQTE